eukprot:Rhum_TRINITY_DN14388_c7_g2::Rhum_TRINITY_DN14388_c7_g2_i2::g.85906::m.85906
MSPRAPATAVAFAASIVLLLGLLPAGADGAPSTEAQQTTVIEPFSDALEPVHLGLMLTGFAITGVMIVAVVVVWLVKGRVSLLHLTTALCSVAVMVGMASWLITYSEMRRELRTQVVQLILSRGEEVLLSVSTNMESGVKLVTLMGNIMNMDLLTMNTSHPAPVAYLQATRRAFSKADSGVAYFYYGTEEGYFHLIDDRGQDSPTVSMWYGFPPNAVAPPVGLSCMGANNESAAGDGGCAACSCADSEPCRAVCQQTCEVFTEATCAAGWAEPVVLVYDAPWGVSEPHVRVNQNFSYDARSRPWYKFALENADGLTHWTEPYDFVQDQKTSVATETGISLVLAVTNKDTGAAEGVLAVDFTLKTLHAVISKQLPTPGSAIFVCTVEGSLITSTMEPSDFLVHRDTAGKPILTVQNVVTHKHPVIRDTFTRVVERMGSLVQAFESRRVVHFSDSTVLISPATLAGGMRLLIVIEVPDSDVYDSSNTASTRALAVVLALSVGLGGIGAALMAVVMRRLRHLRDVMHKVAWLKLEETAMPSSLIEEVHAMQSSFALVTNNLREYKRYLPQVMLYGEDSLDEFSPLVSSLPPGEGGTEPHAAIVFTDIKGSTRLWEECSEGMGLAMTVHNTLMRSLIRGHGGYEVKTIGDSFMVAFATALDAVRFGLDAQKGLHEAEWPAALLDHEGRSKSEGWPGLLVRIGVNYGPVTMENNPLTERMDYMGPTVNRAARLEGASPPGGVTLIEETLRTQGLDEGLGPCLRIPLGERELHGVPGKLSLVCLLHTQLERLKGAVASGALGAKKPTINPLVSAGGGAGGGGDADVPSLRSSSESSCFSLRRSMGLTSTSTDLSPVRCTVTHLQLLGPEYRADDWAKLKRRFQMLVTWLRMTNGVVMSVAGLDVVASWGLVGRSGANMHAAYSLRFAELVQQNIPRTSQFGVVCGLSTGMVSGCHVGDWEARFLAYGGRCLSLCSLLCSLAVTLQTDVLYATEQEKGADPSTLRPVGRVILPESRHVVVAYEVCGGRRASYDGGGAAASDTISIKGNNVASGWSREYARLFHTGQAEEIVQRAEEIGDVVAANAGRLIMGTLLKRTTRHSEEDQANGGSGYPETHPQTHTLSLPSFAVEAV